MKVALQVASVQEDSILLQVGWDSVAPKNGGVAVNS